MLIDWFTVGAQALNFLILVWLMKRFLYKPILHAIDAREQLIAGELADANAKKAEAGKERDVFAQRNKDFDQGRAALLTKAEEEAKVEGRRLRDAARTAADALTAKRNGALQDEARNLHAAISRCAQDEVFAIARKTMADLASASLEERLVAVFERRVRELDEHARAALRDALRSANAPVLVRSAFDLPAEQRAALQDTINVLCSAEIHVRFETAPEVIGGIELTTAGSKLAWSIGEYLAAMEKSLDDLLRKQAMATIKDTAGAAKPPSGEPDHPAAAATPSPATPAPPPPAAPTPPSAAPTPTPAPEAPAQSPAAAKADVPAAAAVPLAPATAPTAKPAPTSA